MPVLCLILRSYTVPPGLLTGLKYLLLAQVILKIATRRIYGRTMEWKLSSKKDMWSEWICRTYTSDRSIQNNGIRPTQFHVMYQ